MNEIQLVFLGPIKQPEYCRGNDWYEDEVRDNEKIKCYHISYGGNYHVGDGFRSGTYRLEVYGAHRFYGEDDYYLDKDLTEMTDWILEHCEGLYEV